MKKILAPVIAILVIIILVLGGKFLMIKFANPASLVASVDQDKIFALDKFQDAQNEYEAYSKEVYELFNKKSQGLPADKKNELMVSYQQQLEQKKAVLLNPLKERIENAINYAAQKNKVEIIIDKKIAVFGIKDLTNEVIKNFESGKTFKLHENTGKSASSPIGYFDQDVIRNLKAFRDADEKLSKIYESMQKEARDKISKISEKDKMKILEQYELSFGKERAALYGPINDLVGKAVEKIAKSKSLSLILDKNSVMYGGLNVTDEVVKEFRSRTESK